MYYLILNKCLLHNAGEQAVSADRGRHCIVTPIKWHL